MDASVPVHVFSYLDHRVLLQDLFAQRKRERQAFSHRAFARRAGLTSTNYLKLVMDGKRNLSASMAARFAQGFGLTREETAYFCELVGFNQAKTAEARARGYERLLRFRGHRKVHELGADQARYHETWYLPAIRELVSLRGFREDPKWIARTLVPRIRVSEARRALTTLLTLRLLTRDEAGRLRQSDPLVSTGTGRLGHHIVSYHRAMLERAGDALERIPRDEREIASLTLCTSQERMIELKRRMSEFRAELLQLAERDAPAERVVQINFQLFPLTRLLEESDA